MGLNRIRVVLGLTAADAALEIKAWHRQEQANAATRRDGVSALIAALGHPHEGEPGMTSTSTITTASSTHTGGVRHEQLDAAVTLALPGGRHLIAVADGFTTDPNPAAPTLSTRILVAFEDELAARLGENADPGSVDRALEAAWDAATDQVDDLDGSTLTAALIDGARIHVMHIGDTRALLHQGKRWEVVTSDHTHVQSLVAEGRLTSEEAASHPERATLNRALAAGARTEPDYIVRTVTSDARLVLLSDGIHGPVRPAEIVRIVQSAVAPADACEKLVNAALGAGGPDNIAVAVADIGL